MNKWKWQHILAMILEIVGLVFLILCIATDTNDDLFLPLALGFVCAGNVISLIMNIRQYRKTKKMSEEEGK